jgi:AraC family transcriptional regulator, transcriptional activator of pobA
MKVIDSISEKHRLLSLPAPLHPLVSVVRVADIRAVDDSIWEHFSLNFYCISLKRNVVSKMQYGQQHYDYDKGVMTFVAPRQVMSLDGPPAYETGQDAGYALFFHPEFLYNHPLATRIKSYGFFSYAVNEALHLSEKEEKNMADIFIRIDEEYQHIDRHTQDVILSQIELLLSYSNRFYERQFITRKGANHVILTRMEQLLNDYFDRQETLKTGIPTVEYVAAQLNLSPHYFSDLLRSLTGQSAQQHIQEKVIERAKEYLTVTHLSVSEIAYQLGFQHPQSLNKLFKRKTSISPLEFRKKFN